MRFNLNTLEFIEENIDSQKIAIATQDQEFTWAEFKLDVEEKIKKLQSFHLPEGHPIVIYGHKEISFVSYMVACISLKIPYIPVDTIYPKARLKTIVNELKSAIVIDIATDTINYNQVNHNTSYKLDDDIIYMLFTSGSTGKPKGVPITTSAVKTFVDWLKTDFYFDSNNVFIGQALFTFDISTIELWGMLFFGGTLVLIDRELSLNNDKFNQLIHKYNCNTISSTPSFILKCLTSEDFTQKQLPALKNFMLIGETLTSRIAKRLLISFPDGYITNDYGPTEATVIVTKMVINNDIINQYSKLLPIGYAKDNDNSKIEIRNKNKDGIGELILFGDNVSMGYLDTSLNKGTFFTENGVRAFNSGDLAYMQDDKIFLVGRADDQIKLNGFRIETAEIDSEILKLKGISDTITIPLKRGAKVVKLISFIILKNKNITKDSIIKELSQTLPEYMLPSDIMFIEKFNYTPSQKLDKLDLIEQYKNS